MSDPALVTTKEKHEELQDVIRKHAIDMLKDDRIEIRQKNTDKPKYPWFNKGWAELMSPLEEGLFKTWMISRYDALSLAKMHLDFISKEEELDVVLLDDDEEFEFELDLEDLEDLDNEPEAEWSVNYQAIVDFLENCSVVQRWRPNRSNIMDDVPEVVVAIESFANEYFNLKEGYERYIAQTNKDNVMVRDELIKWRGYYDKLKVDYEKLSNRLEDTQMANVDLLRKVGNLENDKRELTQTHEKLQQVCGKLEAERDKLKRQNAIQNESIRNKTASLDSFKNLRDAHFQTIDKLKKRVQNLENKVGSQVAIGRMNQQRLSNKDKELFALRSSVQTLKGERDALMKQKRERNDYRKELYELKSQHEQVMNDAVEMAEEYLKQKRELEKTKTELKEARDYAEKIYNQKIGEAYATAHLSSRGGCEDRCCN